MRIAIIEDNDSVAKGIAYRLEDRGHAVDMIRDGLSANEFLRDDGNDLIILDINLPRMSGLEVLRNLRAQGDARPVLLLTAKSEITDRVAGLDAGADDYLSKPFDMDELEARVRALSRRRAQVIETRLEIGPMVFAPQSREVTLAGAPFDLPRRELSVLEALARAWPRVVPKSALHEAVYGTGSEFDDSAIEVHVSRLRKRLRAAGMDIRAQRGLGYRLIEGGAG